MRRRNFISLVIGGAAAWPLAVGAQQPTMPAIGFLDSRSPEAVVSRLRAFRQGLQETGYVEGENVAIVYRFAQNQLERLSDLAKDLVERRVAVIVTPGEPSAFAAKAATATIPVVFVTADDPVKVGLVASLARPDGNITGINFLAAELTAKRLELLRQLLPRADRIAVLVNPAEAARTESTIAAAEAAGRTMGLHIQVFKADTSRQIETAFENMEHDRPDALFIGTSPFLNVRNVQLAMLAAFHRLPGTHSEREYAEAGGLMSYGANIADAFRQMGVYAGRILKGTKLSELPVVQSSKLELVINAPTAGMLGITVPSSLLAVTDEVIE
ncbi:MAG: ABC transporter substrate-binding protein [Xanthobacteraceae bacterium]|jgi:putative ABC transport system substrate-binding protein